MEIYVFRDPANHVEEIKQCYDEFNSLLSLYADQPNQNNKRFLRLLYDLSHVVHHHSFAQEFIESLFSFVETHPQSLSSDVRVAFVQAIIVLHNKGLIETPDLIKRFMPLIRINDKTVRRIICGHFVNVLPGKQTPATKKELRKFVTDENPRVSFKAMQLIVDVFHKENIEDSQTVNFIARSLKIENPRIANMIVSFFIDPYVPRSEDDDFDFEEEKKKAEHLIKVNARSSKAEKKLKNIQHKRSPIPKEPIKVI